MNAPFNSATTQAPLLLTNPVDMEVAPKMRCLNETEIERLFSEIKAELDARAEKIGSTG